MSLNSSVRSAKNSKKLDSVPYPISLSSVPSYPAIKEPFDTLPNFINRDNRSELTKRSLTHWFKPPYPRQPQPKLSQGIDSSYGTSHCHPNILSLIGNTPLVKLRNIVPNPNVTVYAKMESHNPAGSVKDRPALNMILQARQRKILNPQTTLIEPTSGNTGVGLALVASVLGYPLELVMPENATSERSKIMKAFGAKVTLTPATHEMEGAIDYAHEKVNRLSNQYVMLNQFANPDNYLAHYLSTAPEIWYQSHNSITHFVSAMGTTGTIMGVSKFFNKHQLDVEIIGVSPTEGSSIPGIRRWPKAYLPKIFNETAVDKTCDVSIMQATTMARRLALEEGIFCGTSAGGAAHIAIEIASKIESGVIVFIVCDRGDRYLSTDLFTY
ncbi:cysteine synthase B [Spirochaetota bacterium]|nr:cysteine synthase B [Spirochaetota bacterium]